MEERQGGKFRKKKVNFSMVSNDIIRNEKISLRAKGLYALIQSYVTMEDFTLYKGFLQKQCIEGERAFDGAWKELKDNGYLVQYKMREGAKSFYYEYELLDAPSTPTFCTPTKCTPTECRPTFCTPTKRGCINNTIPNNTILNNNLSNHILSEDDVIRQIGYDGASIQDDIVKNIVMLMTEILNMNDSDTVRINQQDMPVSTVKERFRKINYSHVEYVCLVMKNFTGNIASVRNYLLTTLFNAPATCETYYQNRVNHDLYG